MRELQQKQKAKDRLYSTTTLIILGVITIMIIRGAYGVLMKQRESIRLVSDLQTKEKLLSIHESELKANIDRLKTEDGIDTEIKEKYSVSKPGEHVVVIVDPRPNSTTTATTTQNWYRRLWNSIIGN